MGSSSPREILPIFNATLVVFIQNFTAIPMLFSVNIILDDCILPNIQ